MRPCKTHARAAAPDHAYYATVKDRKNSKRAALSEARKIVRQACHILTELGDVGLTAAATLRRRPMVTSPTVPAPARTLQPHFIRWATTAAGPSRAAVSRCRPTKGQAARLIRRAAASPQAGDTQSIILSPGQRPSPADLGKAGCSCPCPRPPRLVTPHRKTPAWTTNHIRATPGPPCPCRLA